MATDTMEFEASPMDASQFEEELVTEGEKIKATKEVHGEPIQVLGIRTFEKPDDKAVDAEGHKIEGATRVVVVARYVSLSGASDGQEHECYVPDKYLSRLAKIFREHPGRPLNCRLFLDPEIGGKVKRGWQIVGLDVIPEDKINKAVMAV